MVVIGSYEVLFYLSTQSTKQHASLTHIHSNTCCSMSKCFLSNIHILVSTLENNLDTSSCRIDKSGIKPPTFQLVNVLLYLLINRNPKVLATNTVCTLLKHFGNGRTGRSQRFCQWWEIQIFDVVSAAYPEIQNWTSHHRSFKSHQEHFKRRVYA